VSELKGLDGRAFGLPGNDMRFRVLADLMPQIVWTAGADGAIDYVNSRWERLSGQPFAREGAASSFESCLHPDDLPAWREAWRQARAQQAAFELVARLGRPGEGQWRRHLHHAVAVLDGAGAVAHWFGTSTDIGEPIDAQRDQDLRALLEERSAAALALSDHLLAVMQERRAAMAQLEAQAAHLNQVITTQSHLVQAELELEGFMTIVVERMLMLTPATGAVIELADGGEMVYRAASGAALPYVGLRLELAGSLSGLCVSTGQVLECGDSRSDPRVDREACLRVGAVSLVVTPLLDRGQVVGVLKILSNRPHAFTVTDQQTVQLMAGMIGAALSHQQQFKYSQQLLDDRTRALNALAKEVERRRRSEETLRASEARTRQIIESSGEAFLMIGKDGTVTDWNRQAEALFGWPREALLGQRPETVLIPPSEHVRFLDAVAQASRQPDQVQRLELVANTRDRGPLTIEMALSGMHMGDDCLCSAFLHDLSERKQREARLRHLVEHDPLTGLLNRRALEALLAQQDAELADMPCALLFLDLDGFKTINDRFGHEAGDVLLKQVAQRLLGVVREGDALARLGGDEFVAVLANWGLTERAVRRVAQQIVKQVALPYELGNGMAGEISASVGVALRAGMSPTLTGAALLRQADEAMYLAKRAGKNRLRFWLPAAPPA